jgi:hypothetical protein
MRHKTTITSVLVTAAVLLVLVGATPGAAAAEPSLPEILQQHDLAVFERSPTSDPAQPGKPASTSSTPRSRASWPAPGSAASRCMRSPARPPGPTSHAATWGP